MGEFQKYMKLEIIENHKNILNKDKSKDCITPFNKYNYLTNKISWQRGKISPGTYFMTQLGYYLNSILLIELLFGQLIFY